MIGFVEEAQDAIKSRLSDLGLLRQVYMRIEACAEPQPSTGIPSYWSARGVDVWGHHSVFNAHCPHSASTGARLGSTNNQKRE